eukprot:TRINITY_DN17323_c0_g1_i1.p2 TRINITY_DN17323_c0_g1~~TRINITY_DN17323_c0_g1_i1.p2  ORF type:complete len:298 (+),score=122.05 TRINITY_DN17323_c0_g1_i1:96-989(+)
MTHPVDPSQMDKSQPPPPCRMKDTPDEQAVHQAKAFLQSFYGAMDAPGGAQRAAIPLRPDTVASFQKGPADRFVGQQQIVQVLQRCHQGQNRDLSGLSVHIFGGSHMLCLVNGDMQTQASAALGLRHRFADFFLLSSDAQGAHVKNMVLREIDEDQGPAPPSNATDPKFAQGDQLGQQFLPAFYGMLDDPAKRQGINALIKDQTCMNVGPDMFKGTQHIAHKLHYFPLLNSPQARQIDGVDTQPSPAGGYFLFVHGEFQMQGEVHTQRFIDLFHLMPEGGSWWITNLMLKMHGGGTR